MASQGFNPVQSAGTGNAGSGTSWTNPQNIEGSSNATCALNNGVNSGNSASLDGYNAGFTLPAGAVITGFQANITAEKTHISGTNTVTFAACSLTIGGASGTPTTTTNVGTAITTSLVGYAFGSSTDLWGISPTDWTQSDVNSATENTGPTFSVVFNSLGVNNVGAQQMQFKVWYTLGGTQQMLTLLGIGC